MESDKKVIGKVIYFSEEEFELVRKIAKFASLPVSSFIRNLSLQKAREIERRVVNE